MFRWCIIRYCTGVWNTCVAIANISTPNSTICSHTILLPTPLTPWFSSSSVCVCGDYPNVAAIIDVYKYYTYILFWSSIFLFNAEIQHSLGFCFDNGPSWEMRSKSRVSRMYHFGFGFKRESDRLPINMPDRLLETHTGELSGAVSMEEPSHVSHSSNISN